MEKRVFLAIFLSFVVLALYQAYFAPKPVEPQPGVPAAGARAAPGATPGSAPASGQPAAGTVPAPANAAAAAPAPIAAAPPNPAARDIVVETDDVRAVFSTEGATLRSWKLKKYRDIIAGGDLELVPMDVPGAVRPFTLATNDPAQTTLLATALYEPSAPGLSLGSAPGTLTFQYKDPSGLTAQKRFYFQPDGKAYLVNVEVSVEVKGTVRPVTLHWGPALGRGYGLPGGSPEMPPRVVQMREGKVERWTAAKLTDQGKFEGNLRFAGIEDHYFVSAAVPVDEPTRVEYQATTLPVPGNTTGLMRNFISFSVGPKTDAAPSRAMTIPFFLGPKDFDKLHAVDAQLVRAIDFGMFAWLVVPLLQALKWINRFVGNYGFSIIILTIFINILIFPLRHRSMVSMKKMQALQPEIKSIQDRYAKYKVTDPERQKMNQEMMALYKQKGVNPASGCVPMLLTMPVLFAFYAMLSVAIELRGAPFVGWIHDLSARDPYYITPFVMGATMLWQQWVTPSTADPTQKKIFMIMPVIFTLTFLTFPAGLVLYWLVSNLLAVSQQFLTNRMIAAPAAVARPAKRA